MNIWIVTIGNSDIQLKTDDNWLDLHREVRPMLAIEDEFCESKVEQRLDDSQYEDRWLYPARALGVVYSSAIQSSINNYDDLDFPLLNSFKEHLSYKNIKLGRIIILLTDQSEIFLEKKREIENTSHPYWKDTCELKPLLKEYFKREFPSVEVKDADFRILKPQRSALGADDWPGLDNWNEVLPLIQSEFATFNIPQGANIYVSHQAGTPAISSAVQFASLARFRAKVQFLVSNEYSGKSQLIEGSTYFSEMQLQKAYALLGRYDYVGVKSLMDEPLKGDAEILLEAAILWNYAEFEKFKDKLYQLSDEAFKDWVVERSQQWWWTAYESAYLAVVRLKQENTVESIFHSFRSVEGLLSKWVDKYHKNLKTGKCSNELKLPDKTPAPWDQTKSIKTLKCYGKELYYAFIVLSKKEIDESRNTDLFVFGEFIFNKRNDLFHQLKGKEREAVFDFWQADSREEQSWERRVLGCLNTIANPEPSFPSLQEASLMHKVHQKLKEAIAPEAQIDRVS